MRNLKKADQVPSSRGIYGVRGDLFLSEHVPGDGCFAEDNIDALSAEFSGDDVSGVDSTVPFDVGFPINCIFRANFSPSICSILT